MHENEYVQGQGPRIYISRGNAVANSLTTPAENTFVDYILIKFQE